MQLFNFYHGPLRTALFYNGNQLCNYSTTWFYLGFILFVITAGLDAEGFAKIGKEVYRVSSFKRRGVYLILKLLGAAFISKIKIEENETMYQIKTVRYFNKIFLKRCGVKL